MSKKTATKQQVKEAVLGILRIAPFFNASEVWLALHKQYPFSVIEAIMLELAEQQLHELRNLPSDILIVDSDGKPLEQVLEENAKKAKKDTE